jgi:RNA-directed DNA polymerase
MNIICPKYYEKYIEKYSKQDTSFNRSKISIAFRKKINNIYIFNIDCLNWIINENNYNIPVFVKTLAKNEIDRRKKMNKSISQFKSANTVYELSSSFGVSYGYLVYLLYKTKETEKYKIGYIPKKTGGLREISSPNDRLKSIQKKLYVFLQELYKVNVYAHGFVSGRNIVTNAQNHKKKNTVLNIDLKDFFPSINFGRVRGLFMEKNFYFNEKVATIIAQICCHKNGLPQGAPTSPFISNMICAKLDFKLKEIAKINHFYYTRYADDITFSTDKYNFKDEIINNIIKAIEEEGFQINEKKKRIQSKYQRQEVTGLTVNKKINVKRNYIRTIRAMLHSWKNDGYKNASQIFFEKSKINKYPHKEFIPIFENSLRGMIEYVGMVRGKDDKIYLKYRNEYLELYNETKGIKDTNKSELLVADSITKKSKVINIPQKAKTIEEKRFEHEKDMIHQPEKVTEALMRFKIERYVLKRLVHSYERDEQFDFENIFAKAKKEFFDDIKKMIPYNLYSNIYKNLILKYENEGRLIFNKTKIHPYDCDINFRKDIDKFKKSIRFGYTNDDQTNLNGFFEDILNYSNPETIKKYKDLLIVNKSSEIKKAQFYTYVKRIHDAIKIIFETIYKHSKSNGCEDVTINLNYSKKRGKKVIILEINHLNSKAMVEPKREFFIGNENELKGDFGKIYNHLKFLCDWEIEAEFENKGFYRIVLLGDKPYKKKIINVKGFTHKLIFYE